MNRMPKYKAWDKSVGQMCDVGEIHFCHGGIKVYGNGVNLGNGWASCDNGFDHDCHVILLGFTGLTDKNGVEIYEGDILTSAEYPFTSDGEKNYAGIIEFEYGCYYLDMVVISERVRGIACGGLLEEYADHCEVIGNIHENPELLK